MGKGRGDRYDRPAMLIIVSACEDSTSARISVQMFPSSLERCWMCRRVTGIAVIPWRPAELVRTADCRWPTARFEEMTAAIRSSAEVAALPAGLSLKIASGLSRRMRSATVGSQLPRRGPQNEVSPEARGRSRAVRRSSSPTNRSSKKVDRGMTVLRCHPVWIATTRTPGSNVGPVASGRRERHRQTSRSSLRRLRSWFVA